ncbi:unnamed protein product [Polarella glacialis]|uniref:CS domain-containing protein n=1 Tax=Polarella glacialis TaxID=89957 RepID=A0A813J7F4_POLGL|nr:unnamed protein product [Polarella glacialis]
MPRVSPYLARCPRRVLLWLTLWAAALADPVKDSAALLQALDSALSQDEATALLAPHMDNLQSLGQQVMEKVVLRQWWDLARDIVAKSHKQQVDLSFAVRSAVRSLKEEADELLRTLNPKYGLAQQVTPAFQWAQNDTSIFLTIKYTVRWNAPGALEVTEPSVNMSGNFFNFSGLGKHSNNKYRYFLSLDLFDNIKADVSTWSSASVGRLSVTLRKRWARKWPRLLWEKKAKIANMHVWMEMQEKLDSTLGGMSSVSNSPITCGATNKLYCIGTDTCKKSANCSQCPGKTEPDLEAFLCAGKPSEKASLGFQDTDMDEHQLGGEIKITRARHDFDVDTYSVFWGKDDRNKLEMTDGKEALVGEALSSSLDLQVRLPQSTLIPDGATHLLVFSQNGYGEYSDPGSLVLKDAALPKAKPGGLVFDDEDGEKGAVRGRVTVLRAENEHKISEYSLHWGRSSTRRSSSSSFISDVRKEEGKDVSHWISHQKIPEGATHLLAFSKNEFGEHPAPASVKIVDKTKPCLEKGADDCPSGVQVSVDSDPDPQQLQVKVAITPAKAESSIDAYALFWGKQSCDSGVENAKNGHIRDFKVGESMEADLPVDTLVPDGSTHLLVFARKDGLGESDFCVSVPIEDNREAEKKEL